MTDVLDDALVCISGNRYSRRRNHWASATARSLSLDTISRLKCRNMVELHRDGRGNEHPFLTAVGRARVAELNLRRAERAGKRAPKRPAGEVASCG